MIAATLALYVILKHITLFVFSILRDKKIHIKDDFYNVCSVVEWLEQWLPTFFI